MNFDETIFDGPSEDAGMADVPQEPTMAQRGDAFEQWLRGQLNSMWSKPGPSRDVVDEILTNYLIHADHQVPLSEPTPDLPVLAEVDFDPEDPTLCEARHPELRHECDKAYGHVTLQHRNHYHEISWTDPKPDPAPLSTPGELAADKALEQLRQLMAGGDAR
jgi:hypothetical protein